MLDKPFLKEVHQIVAEPGFPILIILFEAAHLCYEFASCSLFIFFTSC